MHDQMNSKYIISDACEHKKDVTWIKHINCIQQKIKKMLKSFMLKKSKQHKQEPL